MGIEMLPVLEISIHALRAEGDRQSLTSATHLVYFNPRPPCGGRPVDEMQKIVMLTFQSTPSVRRATGDTGLKVTTKAISIHALRAEGDEVGDDE